MNYLIGLISLMNYLIEYIPNELLYHIHLGVVQFSLYVLFLFTLMLFQTDLSGFYGETTVTGI